MSAEGNAVLLATKDVVFDVAHNTERSDSSSRGKGWGFANNTSGLPFGTNNSQSQGGGSSDTITGTQLSIGGGVRMATTKGDISLDAARQSDDRLQKMQGVAAGAKAYQAASAISALSGRAGSGDLFSAEAGIGFKTANSSADGSSTVSRGSTIQGGGNVNLTSTTGDIHVVQGNLSAGNTLSLDSAGDILLEAGKAHVADRSKSSNAGAEVGIGVVVGAQTGVYVYAEASVDSSKSNSESNTWQNTTLIGQKVSLKAEDGPTLPGATATADRIGVKKCLCTGPNPVA